MLIHFLEVTRGCWGLGKADRLMPFKIFFFSSFNVDDVLIYLFFSQNLCSQRWVVSNVQRDKHTKAVCVPLKSQEWYSCAVDAQVWKATVWLCMTMKPPAQRNSPSLRAKWSGSWGKLYMLLMTVGGKVNWMAALDSSLLWSWRSVVKMASLLHLK